MSSPHAANAQATAGCPPDQSSQNTIYSAPYHRNESPYEDHYIIAFKPGHSLAKHFAFLRKEFEISGTLNEGYYAKLDRELFDAVRRDPGVESIEDDAIGEWWDPSEEELEQASREEAERERARQAEEA